MGHFDFTNKKTDSRPIINIFTLSTECQEKFWVGQEAACPRVYLTYFFFGHGKRPTMSICRRLTSHPQKRWLARKEDHERFRLSYFS
jgi:hypothetical protein